MIISVLNIKGGVGKTTVATNLAVGIAKTGKSVLLIDTDTQGSAVAWRGEREQSDANVTVISLCSAAALRKQIIGFREGFDCIIIDGSPHVDALAAGVSVGQILRVLEYQGKGFQRGNEIQQSQPLLQVSFAR